MHVEWSDCARDDLHSLVAYISRDSAFYAKTFGEKIILATRRLKDFPQSGRMIPEADAKTLREIIVRGYRGMYRPEDERVLILAVMHGSRDLSRPDNRQGKRIKTATFLCQKPRPRVKEPVCRFVLSVDRVWLGWPLYRFNF